MCPLYPLHIVLLYLCLTLPLLLAVVDGASSLASWKLNFSKEIIGVGNETEKLRELTSQQLELECDNCEQEQLAQYKVVIENQDPNIAFIQSR